VAFVLILVAMVLTYLGLMAPSGRQPRGPTLSGCYRARGQIPRHPPNAALNY